MATRKIETEIALLGEKEFNDQMKGINGNLKSLKAEMGVVTTSFDENATASQKLTAKQNVLAQQIDQQEEAVRALTAMYEKCKEQLGENSAQADKYKQAMLSAKTALNKMESESRKLTNQLKEAQKAEEAEAKALTQYTSLTSRAKSGLSGITSAVKGYAGEVKTAAAHTPVLAEALDILSAAAKSANLALKSAGKVGTAAIKGTAAGMAALATSSAAATVGITALATVGFKKMTEYAIEAAKSGNPRFAELASNITALEDASGKAKAAIGGVLLPSLTSLSSEGGKLLGDFSAEMEAAGTDTEAVGGVMAKYIRKSAELIRKEAPQFIKAGGNLIAGLTEGIIENADEIGEAAEDVIGQLADMLDENAEELGEAAAVIVSTLGELIGENSPELFSAGVAMITSLLEGLDGEKLGQTAADLFVLLLTTLLTLAPELATAGWEFIASLISGIVEKWPDIKDAGRQMMEQLWDGLKEIFEDIVSWFQDAVSRLRGTAYVDVQVNDRGFSGTSGHFATGLDYVPYDEFPAMLHRGEMVVPASLASQLRDAGINKNTRRLDSSGGEASQVQVTNTVNVKFEGSLAQLARVLQPYIKVEEERRGPQLIK